MSEDKAFKPDTLHVEGNGAPGGAHFADPHAADGHPGTNLGRRQSAVNVIQNPLKVSLRLYCGCECALTHSDTARSKSSMMLSSSPRTTTSPSIRNSLAEQRLSQGTTRTLRTFQNSLRRSARRWRTRETTSGMDPRCSGSRSRSVRSVRLPKVSPSRGLQRQHPRD